MGSEKIPVKHGRYRTHDEDRCSKQQISQNISLSVVVFFAIRSLDVTAMAEPGRLLHSIYHYDEMQAVQIYMQKYLQKYMQKFSRLPFLHAATLISP